MKNFKFGRHLKLVLVKNFYQRLGSRFKNVGDPILFSAGNYFFKEFFDGKIFAR